MPNASTGPVVLYSNAIPISPADLDFGDQVTKEQINGLSRFSQMVNDIPSTGSNVWIPTGTKAWNIYDLVLSQAQFPQAPSASNSRSISGSDGRLRSLAADNASAGSPIAGNLEFAIGETGITPSAAFSPAAYACRNIPIVGSLDQIVYREPVDSLLSVAGTAMADTQDSIAPALEKTGFRLGNRVRAEFRLELEDVERPPVDSSFAPVIAGPTARGVAGSPQAELQLSAGQTSLASTFLSLQAEFKMDARTDMLGATFYPTPFFPPDFYTSAYDSYWQPFEITPQPGDVWMPVDNGGKITGEMISVVLQRAWWSTWVFSNHGWRFNPLSGMGLLSDGRSPTSGMMPLYCSSLLIARNVRTIPGTANSGTSTSARPFTLSQSSTGSFGIAIPAPDPTGMMILGFVCMPLPMSPDPDPSLYWPS